MANTATVLFFFVLASLFFCSHQAVITWTLNMPLSPPEQPILMRTDSPCLLCAHTTHNNHTTASIDSRICPSKHVWFKPSLLASITMPNLLTIKVPSCLEKRRHLSAPSVATAAFTASLMTSGDAKVEDDFTMLDRL